MEKYEIHCTEWGSTPRRLRRQRLAFQSQETQPLHHYAC